MGRINLQGLIDEVLGMVKKKKEEESALLRDQSSQPSWYGGNKDEEQYWKEMRTKNADIEKQKLVNAGTATVANINESGALARQGLANIGNENVARTHLEGVKYNADLGLRGTETTAKAHVEASKSGKVGGEDPFSTLLGKAIESDASLLSDPKRLNEVAANLRSFAPPSVKRKDDYYTPDNNVTPPAVPQTALPVSKPGARSMEFPTNMGTAQSPLREKEQAKEAFYRMNPQLKKKRESFFGF
jgi:hypothetical protein